VPTPLSKAVNIGIEGIWVKQTQESALKGAFMSGDEFENESSGIWLFDPKLFQMVQE